MNTFLLVVIVLLLVVLGVVIWLWSHGVSIAQARADIVALEARIKALEAKI